MINKVLYLGPVGSYSDIAKNKFSKYFSENCKYETVNSISQIIRRIGDLNIESVGAVIPIENSIEGIVRDTQDNLFSLEKLGYRIYAETNLLIEHCLIGYAKKNEIKSIKSHPQALAQCRDYIYENWGENIELLPVLSTSGAVSSLEQKTPDVVAIGSKYSAQMYNIPIIDEKINDKKNNTTRFVLLSKMSPKKSEQNKVSIIFSTENKSGALNKVLNIIERYGLNMSYIDSRPSRNEIGEYVFYVDFAGHIQDGDVSNALIEMQPLVKMFSVLSEGAICV